MIPKDARDLFGIEAGDTLLVLANRAQGIALVDNDRFQQLARGILAAQDEADASDA